MSKWGLIDKTLEGRQRVYFPHFSSGRVPIDPAQNRVWRQRLFGISDPRERALVKRMCREDFLFYLSGFVHIFDAGDDGGTGGGEPGPVPFVPYEFQVEAFTAMWACMNGELRCPARVKKPRRMGVTWMAVSLFEHCWHFYDNRHLLVGSRREEEVDGTISIARGDKFSGEWSKLLPKVDFIHLYQPSWLWPDGYKPRVEPYRSRMKILNPERGSIIWGTSATGKAGRQERGWAVLWDEAAHTDNLYEIIGGLSKFAPCKFWVSSIGDLGHAFSTTLKDAPGVVQIPLEWWMHPEYSRDLRIDQETGTRTSPWLERQLEEINHDAQIANREYFADESQQIGGFYHADTFRVMLGVQGAQGMLGGTVRDADMIGALDILDRQDNTSQVVRWVDQPGGRWRIWGSLAADGRPSRGTRYVIGADVAAGTVDSDGRGASNSVLVVADWLTGEVVAEYVVHGVRPETLAREAYAASFWWEGDDFMPARINWERNGGPGLNFGQWLLDRRHPNLWRDADGKHGWYNGATARLAFGLHQQMICERRFTERSMDCANEMRHYQNPASGKGPPVHTASLHATDPSGARANHGDRTTARVVVCQVLQKPYVPQSGDTAVPYGSYKYLELKRQQDSRKGVLA